MQYTIVYIRVTVILIVYFVFKEQLCIKLFAALLMLYTSVLFSVIIKKKAPQLFLPLSFSVDLLVS